MHYSRFWDRNSAQRSNGSPPSELDLFVRAIRGDHDPGEIQQFVKAIRGDSAPSEREQLEWLAKISTRHEEQLRALQKAEAEAKQTTDRPNASADDPPFGEGWDSSKHPRTGTDPNPGHFASTGGSSGGSQSTSFLDAVIKRNQTIADLTGGPSQGTIRSSQLANDLQAAGKLPDEVARAAAANDAGLRTGGKAVFNGFATAVKNVATLGLDSSQLEKIGVTDEDREAGYDDAVTIATASGELLIAVLTAGASAVLSKGGTIARVASGALIAYDAAGNAVGVVQGAYDAKENGVNFSNGTKVAAGVLGLGASAMAAKGLQSAGPGKPHIAKPDGDSSAAAVRVKPSELKFSQTTAGGSGRAAELRKSMASGWNGPAIDAVNTSDGLVTIDNTRVAVARELGIRDIPVNVRLASDPLPDSMLGRFGSARTWGEALKYRTSSQNPPLPPTGATIAPRMPH